MVIFSLIALSYVGVLSQKEIKIPRKIRGNYSGIQETYSFQQHGESFTIPVITLQINLNKYTVSMCFPSNAYCPIRETKAFTWRKEKSKVVQRFIFQVNDDASVLKEEWELDVKKRQIIRVGIAPQPNTVLTKSRKKQ